MTAATTDIQKKPPVEYVPTAPVGNIKTMRTLFEQNEASLRSVLPKHVTADRLLKMMMVAINRNPALLECTQASLLETVNRAGELGLDLSGTLGEAYPVPFNNKIKLGDGREIWAKQCQLVIGYRGLHKLARQSGEVATVSADVVCKNDRFTFRKGGNAVCEWEPPLQDDRGEVIGAFAHVQFKDGTQQFDYMTASEIEKIRGRSKTGNSGPWQNDWNEMAKKTVFKRLSKWLPLSAEKADAFHKAIQHDNDLEIEDTLPPAPEPKRGSAGLIERLEARKEAGDATHTDDTPQAVASPSEAADASGVPSEREQAIIFLEDRYFEANPRLAKESDAKMKERFIKWASAQSNVSFKAWSDLADETAAMVVAACQQSLDDMK